MIPPFRIGVSGVHAADEQLSSRAEDAETAAVGHPPI